MSFGGKWKKFNIHELAQCRAQHTRKIEGTKKLLFGALISGFGGPFVSTVCIVVLSERKQDLERGSFFEKSFPALLECTEPGFFNNFSKKCVLFAKMHSRMVLKSSSIIFLILRGSFALLWQSQIDRSLMFDGAFYRQQIEEDIMDKGFCLSFSPRSNIETPLFYFTKVKAGP